MGSNAIITLKRNYTNVCDGCISFIPLYLSFISHIAEKKMCETPLLKSYRIDEIYRAFHQAKMTAAGHKLKIY